MDVSASVGENLYANCQYCITGSSILSASQDGTHWLVHNVNFQYPRVTTVAVCVSISQSAKVIRGTLLKYPWGGIGSLQNNPSQMEAVVDIEWVFFIRSQESKNFFLSSCCFHHRIHQLLFMAQTWLFVLQVWLMTISYLYSLGNWLHLTLSLYFEIIPYVNRNSFMVAAGGI